MDETPKQTILNVDDNDASRYVTGLLLSREGFEVIEATTGTEALQQVKAHPDLILLDVNLPDLSGFEVCQRIKDDPATSWIPVLHLSATYLDDQSKVKGLEGGAEGYLTQPVEPQVLIAYVKALIRARRAEAELDVAVQQWRTTFDAMSDGVSLLDLEGKVLRCNRAMADILRKPLDEILGHPCWELVHGTSEPIEGCPVVCMWESRHRETLDVPIGDRWFVVTVDPLLDEDGHVTGAVHALSDITKRKQIEKELRHSQEQLRKLSAHLESAREGERTRIAREIHDVLGQEMTALKMDLSWLSKRIPQDQPPLRKKIASMSALLDSTIHTVQRISRELRPGLLDHLGIGAAIEWAAKDVQDRTGIECTVRLDSEDMVLDPDRSTALFRIFQETLTNVVRHARATRVEVSLSVKAGKVVLEVRDNGRGITYEEYSNPMSLGLLGMRERVYPYGGEVDIRGVPGKGTTVTVRIPLDREGGA